MYCGKNEFAIVNYILMELNRLGECVKKQTGKI